MAAEWLVDILGRDEEDVHTEIQDDGESETGLNERADSPEIDRESIDDRVCDICIKTGESCVVESGRQACRRCGAKKLRCSLVDRATKQRHNSPAENFDDRACNVCIKTGESCVVDFGRQACRGCGAKKLRCSLVDPAMKQRHDSTAEPGSGLNKPTHSLEIDRESLDESYRANFDESDRESFDDGGASFDKACDTCMNARESCVVESGRKACRRCVAKKLRCSKAPKQRHDETGKARKRERGASVESQSQPAHKKTRWQTREDSGPGPIAEGSRTEIAELNDRIDKLLRKQQRLKEQLQAAEKREEQTGSVLAYHHQAIRELLKQGLQQDDKKFKIHLERLDKYEPLWDMTGDEEEVRLLLAESANPAGFSEEEDTLLSPSKSSAGKEMAPQVARELPEKMEVDEELTGESEPAKQEPKAETAPRRRVEVPAKEGRPHTVKPEPIEEEGWVGPGYNEGGRKKRLMKRASKLFVPDDDDYSAL
ncbi:hypothetical protein B0H16DRAFT_377987 [Mycena metata]|uniref:Zn(2)-C6 fungal-type domain-containing protein n=1 Tax=Mycena metata TaxID=1033252 RepID=A0AAD7MKY3_9AGAR|nr:hypothetical protein B0H16DRAFT_377987 [Mycena metata]